MIRLSFYLIKKETWDLVSERLDNHDKEVRSIYKSLFSLREKYPEYKLYPWSNDLLFICEKISHLELPISYELLHGKNSEAIRVGHFHGYSNELYMYKDMSDIEKMLTGLGYVLIEDNGFKLKPITLDKLKTINQECRIVK